MPDRLHSAGSSQPAHQPVQPVQVGDTATREVGHFAPGQPRAEGILPYMEQSSVVDPNAGSAHSGAEAHPGAGARLVPQSGTPAFTSAEGRSMSFELFRGGSTTDRADGLQQPEGAHSGTQGGYSAARHSLPPSGPRHESMSLNFEEIKQAHVAAGDWNGDGMPDRHAGAGAHGGGNDLDDGPSTLLAMDMSAARSAAPGAPLDALHHLGHAHTEVEHPHAAEAHESGHLIHVDHSFSDAHGGDALDAAAHGLGHDGPIHHPHGL